jgi:hypothetical protein
MAVMQTHGNKKKVGGGQQKDVAHPTGLFQFID